MPQRITTTQHQWMGAAVVTVTEQQARNAIRKKTLRVPGNPGEDDIRIDVAAVYCSHHRCGEAWEDAASEPCAGRSPDATHAWVAAVWVPMDDVAAARAVRTKAVALPGRLVIDILETACRECRRGWVDVADRPCEAAESNEHLRGGPIGERAKRVHRHDCAALGCPGPLPPVAERKKAKARAGVAEEAGDGDAVAV